MSKLQTAHKIEFRISFEDSVSENVYITEETHEKLPDMWTDNGAYYLGKDYSSINREYFTKEKIESMKQKLCKKIMESENPFEIYIGDTDCYEVKENKIFK